MYTSFHIAENRLDELKSFIRAFTPTVRFKHNPLKEGNQWFIALTMEVEDSSKLNELFSKWHDEALRKHAVSGRSEQFYCLNRSIFGDGRKCEKQCLSCEKNIPKQ